MDQQSSLALARERIKGATAPQGVVECQLCHRKFTKDILLFFHHKSFHELQPLPQDLDCEPCGNAQSDGTASNEPPAINGQENDVVPFPEALKEIEHRAIQANKKTLSPSKMIGSKATSKPSTPKNGLQEKKPVARKDLSISFKKCPGSTGFVSTLAAKHSAPEEFGSSPSKKLATDAPGDSTIPASLNGQGSSGEEASIGLSYKQVMGNLAPSPQKKPSSNEHLSTSKLSSEDDKSATGLQNFLNVSEASPFLEPSNADHAKNLTKNTIEEMPESSATCALQSDHDPAASTSVATKGRRSLQKVRAASIRVSPSRMTKLRAREASLKVCRFCRSTFGNYESYQRHMKVKHKIKNTQTKYPCSICNVQCIHKEGWHAHFKKHLPLLRNQQKCQDSGSATYPCPFCTNKYSNLRDRYAHVCEDHFKASSTEVKLFLDLTFCSTCSLFFATAAEANQHAQSQHATQQDSHIVSAKGNKYTLKFSCPHCPTKCANAFVLSSHLRKTHGEISKSILCSFCSLEFPSYKDWSEHFLSYLHPKLESAFICKVCGKKFRMEAHLNQHLSLARHWPNGTPPSCFLCMEKCESWLHRAKHLLSHLYPHHAALLKEYLESLVCKVCKEVFTSDQDMPRHLCGHKNGEQDSPPKTSGLSSVPIHKSPSSPTKYSVKSAKLKRFNKVARVFYGCDTCSISNLKRLIGLKHHLKSKPHLTKFTSEAFSRNCPQCGEAFENLTHYILHRVDTLLSPNSSHQPAIMPFSCELCQLTHEYPSIHLLSHLGIRVSESPFESTSLLKKDSSENPNVLMECSPQSSVESDFLTQPTNGTVSPTEEVSCKKLKRTFSELLYLATNDAAILSHYGFGMRKIEAVLADILQVLDIEPEKCAGSELDNFKTNIMKLLRHFVNDSLLDTLERDCASTEELVEVLVGLFREELAKSLSE